jgi:LuxR family maltose regulon positive regulatory protein
VIEILLTHALVHQAQGNRLQAVAALERALILAEPESYLRIFADEGESMREQILDFRIAIEESAPNGAHPLFGYVDKLLTAFPQPPAAAPKSKNQNLKHLHPLAPYARTGVAQVQVSEFVEPLSEREMEVLRLLRSELSGPEIAQQLVVSLNTLRTHTKNIFNKLGVNNRRAAVHRAEELDLF